MIKGGSCARKNRITVEKGEESKKGKGFVQGVSIKLSFARKVLYVTSYFSPGANP